jgi:hypothetical protein
MLMPSAKIPFLLMTMQTDLILNPGKIHTTQLG